MKFYTSYELSKKLYEAGFRKPSHARIERKHLVMFDTAMQVRCIAWHCYTSYHILEDICIRYAKEFLTHRGDELFGIYEQFRIAKMLYENRPHEEIENYIWDNCIFNKAKSD